MSVAAVMAGVLTERLVNGLVVVGRSVGLAAGRYKPAKRSGGEIESRRVQQPERIIRETEVKAPQLIICLLWK
jgi:hypothetical protein